MQDRLNERKRTDISPSSKTLQRVHFTLDSFGFAGKCNAYTPKRCSQNGRSFKALLGGRPDLNPEVRLLETSLIPRESSIGQMSGELMKPVGQNGYETGSSEKKEVVYNAISTDHPGEANWEK